LLFLHNLHALKRTFASDLDRGGFDVEHITRLGGWQSLDVVLRYTRSAKVEDRRGFGSFLERDGVTKRCEPWELVWNMTMKLLFPLDC